jgi:electron transfer flavoprotein alpha subunit
MIAVALIRCGSVPAGADEAACEAGGDIVLVGSGTERAAEILSEVATRIWTVEVGPSPDDPWPSVAALTTGIVRALEATGRIDDTVVLPASPDGRDLAPVLAHRLGRPLHSGAVAVDTDAVSVTRGGGLQIVDLPLTGPAVCTLQVGCRGVDLRDARASITELAAFVPTIQAAASVVTTEVLPPDAATMDLSEARRIVGGGAGLQSAEAFAVLDRVAQSLDASMGVTRVITDRGWASHDRQIGTTGVVVNPRLYLSFGISGAVQHTSGLGRPDHIISVNTDAHCPMMQMSDLAIVADANLVLEELTGMLGSDSDS